MSEGLRSILLGTAGLGVAAFVALVLAVSRSAIREDPAALRAAVRSGLVAVVFQGVHALEEFGAGFHERYPALLGLPAWPPIFFAAFNLFWLVLWSLSIWGLTMRRKAALFPLWFLGIAGVVNGVAHPAFSAATHGYFPGLISAPAVGFAGVVLMRRLSVVTAAPHGRRCLDASL
jgi:hypothetical protein